MIFILYLAQMISSVALGAEPILLTDFVAPSPSQVEIIDAFEEEVSARLVDDGYIVLTSRNVAPIVGDMALEDCASLDSCPMDFLDDIPARGAVVLGFETLGETLIGTVSVYLQGRSTVVVAQEIPLATGHGVVLASEVSTLLWQIMANVDPSGNDMLLAAAQLIAGGGKGAPPQASQTRSDPTAKRTVSKKTSAIKTGGKASRTTSIILPPTGLKEETGSGQKSKHPKAVQRAGMTKEYAEDATIEDMIEGTNTSGRFVLGAAKSLRKSKLDVRDWMYRATPHGGRVIIEIRSGIGMGDVDRSADVRINILDGVVQNDWYQEGPAPARRVRGSIFAGYAPISFLDLGLLFGLQYGERSLTTGWYRTTGENTDRANSDQQFVQAVQFILQPRIRGYLIHTGPAKPYIFVGGDFRIFDDYEIEQPANLSYPSPPAGMVPGIVSGLGLSIDPSPIFGIIVEGAYIHHFGSRAGVIAEGEWPHGDPFQPEGAGYTISVVGGVQFRL